MTLRLVSNLAAAQPALPDYAEEEPTAVHPDQERPAPARRASYVRIKPEHDGAVVDAERVDLDRFTSMIDADVRRLSTLLEVVGRASLPFDPSARAAALALARRVGDVAYVRDALAAVSAAAVADVAPLAAPDAPLGPYVKGLGIWCDGVLDALAVLERELERLSPSWPALRTRLAEASLFHFDGLASQVREHVRILDAAGYAGAGLATMADALEELFFACRVLTDALARPFG